MSLTSFEPVRIKVEVMGDFTSLMSWTIRKIVVQFDELSKFEELDELKEFNELNK